MAGGGRQVTGITPRLLQLGLDLKIEHFANQYVGEVDRVFETKEMTKGFYEFVTMSGMGLAGPRNEGSDTLFYDTINQDNNAHYAAICYTKSARITKEAIEDNMYEDMISVLGEEIMKAHKYNKDYQAVSILNNATSGSYTWADGKSLMATDHPVFGTTSSNRLSPDLDLSEDAVEQAVILIDNFLNPDGLNSEYKSKDLIVPVALKYVAARIIGSKDTGWRTATADRDIGAVMHRGDLQDYITWKRLNGNTTWFISTDAKNGLIMAERKGIETKAFQDPFTFDTVITSRTRFRPLVGDWRCIAGSVGP